MELYDILSYWRVNRGRGHSEVLMRGAEASERCIIVVANDHQARDYRERTKASRHIVVTIHDQPQKLYGLQLPLVVDHFAMQLLCEQHTEKLVRMSTESRNA